MTKPGSAIRAVSIVTGLDGRSAAAAYAEHATCPCGAQLDFDVDAIGRTVEMCTNPKCPNSRAHVPGSLKRHGDV